jgi:flagellar basal-body rod protein FlgG
MPTSALNAAATGMMAQEKQIESIANNLANTQTTGYKKSRAEFQDLLYENIQEPGMPTSQSTSNPTGIQRGSGTRQVATQRNMSAGTMKGTGRDLDVGIDGEGFLVVQLPGGEFAYTRDGSLKKDKDGRLITAADKALEPAITIPANSVSVHINQNGIVTIEDPQHQVVQVGQIQLATFVNPEGLKPIGGGLFVETASSGPATRMNPGQEIAGDIMQNHLEGSNVNPVEELVNMIGAQRAYELNSKVVNTVDQMLQATNNLK